MRFGEEPEFRVEDFPSLGKNFLFIQQRKESLEPAVLSVPVLPLLKPMEPEVTPDIVSLLPLLKPEQKTVPWYRRLWNWLLSMAKKLWR